SARRPSRRASSGWRTTGPLCGFAASRDTPFHGAEGARRLEDRLTQSRKAAKGGRAGTGGGAGYRRRRRAERGVEDAGHRAVADRRLQKSALREGGDRAPGVGTANFSP